MLGIGVPLPPSPTGMSPLSGGPLHHRSRSCPDLSEISQRSLCSSARSDETAFGPEEICSPGSLYGASSMAGSVATDKPASPLLSARRLSSLGYTLVSGKPEDLSKPLEGWVLAYAEEGNIEVLRKALSDVCINDETLSMILSALRQAAEKKDVEAATELLTVVQKARQSGLFVEWICRDMKLLEFLMDQKTMLKIPKGFLNAMRLLGVYIWNLTGHDELDPHYQQPGDYQLRFEYIGKSYLLNSEEIVFWRSLPARLEWAQ
jgi:hypothetical protein